MMEILRTPEERFADLPGYPFALHHLEVNGFRIHYVGEGPAAAGPVLLLHGEPSWSYLYRKMIPPILAAGLRSLAPDFAGFGRSDKPAPRDDYSYQFHVDVLAGFLERRAWAVFENWSKPFLTAFSDGDPVTSGGDLATSRTRPSPAQVTSSKRTKARSWRPW